MKQQSKRDPKEHHGHTHPRSGQDRVPESLIPIIMGVYASCPSLPWNTLVTRNSREAWNHVLQCERCKEKFEKYRKMFGA